MAKEIVWTQRAIDQFNLVIKYLEKEWGARVTQAFVERTYTIIELISIYPKIGSIEQSEKMIRGFIITKHNRLFYRETENEIIILHIFDNRQHYKKKKY